MYTVKLLTMRSLHPVCVCGKLVLLTTTDCSARILSPTAGRCILRECAVLSPPAGRCILREWAVLLLPAGRCILRECAVLSRLPATTYCASVRCCRRLPAAERCACAPRYCRLRGRSTLRVSVMERKKRLAPWV